MSQLDFFRSEPEVAASVLSRNLSKRDDPGSSHAAAFRFVASGRLGLRQVRALDAVRCWPGRTAHELENLLGVARNDVARRLPELELKRLIWRQRGKAGELISWPVCGGRAPQRFVEDEGLD